MAWAFVSAVRRGTVVTVAVSDGAETVRYAFSYPMKAGQTLAQFRTRVKAEVVAYLAALNGADSDEDVSEEYRP